MEVIGCQSYGEPPGSGYEEKEHAQSHSVGQWQSQDCNLSFLTFSECLCDIVSTTFPQEIPLLLQSCIPSPTASPYKGSEVANAAFYLRPMNCFTLSSLPLADKLPEGREAVLSLLSTDYAHRHRGAHGTPRGEGRGAGGEGKGRLRRNSLRRWSYWSKVRE